MAGLKKVKSEKKCIQKRRRERGLRLRGLRFDLIVPFSIFGPFSIFKFPVSFYQMSFFNFWSFFNFQISPPSSLPSPHLPFSRLHTWSYLTLLFVEF
jgi:hypothetical protein